ncbi:MAG: MarR family transcriptional regulator [Lachnospiraceae bacterium]|nr:MarR family transcriptional regulator [Lachnospiraceae bacterium]
MDDKVELLLNGHQYRRFQEAYFSAVFEEYELNLADIRVLLFLYEHKSCDTARDIVENHYLAKSYVSKSVEKLIEHGFLERKHLQEDRRYVHLLVREEAIPVIEEVRQQKQKMLERLFQGISPEHIAVLQEIAGKISSNITDISR